MRPIMWKYYKSQMDKYIGKVLDERFAVRDASVPKTTKKKTGIDRKYRCCSGILSLSKAPGELRVGFQVPPICEAT